MSERTSREEMRGWRDLLDCQPRLIRGVSGGGAPFRGTAVGAGVDRFEQRVGLHDVLDDALFQEVRGAGVEVFFLGRGEARRCLCRGKVGGRC